MKKPVRSFKSVSLRQKGDEYRESFVVETLKRLGFNPEVER